MNVPHTTQVYRYGVLAILLLGLLALLSLARPPQEEVDVTLLTISEKRAYFEKTIHQLGGSGAYAQFLASVGTNEFSASHSTAHLFGETLYEVMGVDGISVCDTSLNFGCYHGFFTGAVRTEGLPVVGRLDSACGALGEGGAYPCRHGIGHGILEYLGHTKIAEALVACDATTQPTPIGGCTSGVFMEYNIPLVENAEGVFSVSARTLSDSTRPYEPCSSLPERFGLACYHELPQWWLEVFDEDIMRIGQLCANAPTVENQTSCFAGVGNIAWMTVGGGEDNVVAFCNRMPSTEAQQTCIIHAGWSLPSSIKATGAQERLCNHLPEPERTECLP